VDSHNQIHTLIVEHVGRVTGFDWLSSIIVKLPDSLAGRSEDVSVSVSFRGVRSSGALVRIKP